MRYHPPMTRSVLALVFASILGCSGRMTGVPRDAGSDAGRSPERDAGRRRDAGDPPIDASEPDAGPPDAGAPPCACPPFPAECGEVELDVPAFTPEAQDVAAQLFGVIACAERSLHLAVYEADWTCIAAALQTQLEREPELEIEIVVDNERCAAGSCIFDALEGERVTLLRDSRNGAFMHHKWVIADEARVWIGSTNFTERSFCIDHNNSIVLEQPEIVARYEQIFARMWTGGFSPVEPEPAVVAGIYTSYFSPESPSDQPSAWHRAILDAIAAATVSIEVMINAWTQTDIADALVAAHVRGVEVRAIVSNLYADEAPALALAIGDVPVRRDNVHDKLLVVDGHRVATGSPNWSENAWGNNENSLWIDDTGVAALYRAEFEVAFAEARPVVVP
jgi:hypothetical protein